MKNFSAYLALGKKIYGPDNSCLLSTKSKKQFENSNLEKNIAELKSEILKLAPKPESWAAMKGDDRKKFKALGISLYIIAHRFGLKGNPYNSLATYLDLGKKIYGDEHEFLTQKKYPPRDNAYYLDKEKIKHDLEAFASKLGAGKTPMDLNIGNMESNRAFCSNGEEVRGTTWIRNAVVALGFAKNADETSGFYAKTLKILFKTAGIELRDEDYYRNPEKVKHDLDAFAKDLGEGMTSNDLNTTNLRRTNAICANGEKVNGNTWVKNAAVALGLAKNSVESNGKKAEALKKLKEIAGRIN